MPIVSMNSSTGMPFSTWMFLKTASAIGTFRGLSRAEADRIQPSRLDFYTARPGDTWESIVKARSDAGVTASTLAIMNGQEPGTSPRPGDRIRIVVGG